MQSKNTTIENKPYRFFHFALAFYPLFSCYATFIDGLSIGDIVLIIAVIFSVFNGRRIANYQVKPNTIHIIFLIYCLVACFFSYASGVNIAFALVLKRFIKYGMFIFIICLFPTILDEECFILYFKKFIKLLIVGLFVQYILYYGFGYTLVLKIPFLKYSNDMLENIDFSSRLAHNFRPSSFLLEPAGLSYILIVYLVYVLFEEKHDNHWGVRVIICSIAPIITVSSSALILEAIVFSAYVITLTFKHNFGLIKKIIYISVFLVLLLIGMKIYMSSSLSNSLSRMLYSHNAVQAESVWSRLSAGDDLVGSLSGIDKFFGVGLGNISVYTNSINYLLYCTGIIGLSIMFIWAMVVFVKSNLAGRVLLISFVALWFSSRIIISGEVLIYNAFLLIYIASKEASKKLPEGYM